MTGVQTCALPIYGVTRGSVPTTGDLDITANGVNGLAAGILLANGHIGVDSTGPVSINSATARGTYALPPSGTAEGYIFINAAGPVNLGTANAATMLGVSGNGVTGTGAWIAGEDVLILSSGAASLDTVTAGDDLEARINGAMTINFGEATGLARDNRAIDLVAGPSGTSFVILDPTAPNGADIRLTSTTGTITSNGLTAGDDIAILASAGAANLNGTTRTRGIGTTGGASNIDVSALTASVNAADAFTDLTVLTNGNQTLGTSRSGRALIGTSAAGSVGFTALTSGTTTTLTAATAVNGGTAQAGTALTINGNGVSTGNLSGQSATVGSATTASTGTLTTTAGDLLVRAASGITAGDTSVTGGNARFASGGALLIGNVSVTGDLLAGEPLLGVPSTNALTIGTVNAGGAAGLYASSVTAGAVTAGTHVDINSVNSPAGGPISTGAINAGTYVEIRTNDANVTTGAVVAGTDLAIDALGAGSLVSTGNLTAGDDLLVSGATVNTGDLLSTGLGSDAAIGLPLNFGAAGPAGRVIRVSADTAATLGNITTPDRIILYSANGSITAGDVSAPQAIMGFVRGNLSLGTIATAGHFYVGDSSQYLPNAANLFSTYDPALLASLTPVRTSGSLTVGGPLSAGDVTIAVGTATALPGLTQATRRVRIDVGGDLNVAGGISAGSGILLNADGAIQAGNLITLSGDVGATATSGIAASNVTAPGSIDLATVSGALTFGAADAGNDLRLNAPGGAITGISARAGDDIAITGASVVLPDVIARGLDGSSAVSVSGTNGVTIQRTAITGTLGLTATNGAVLVATDLAASGPVSALGRSVSLTSLGALNMASAQATAGDLTVNTGGALTVGSASATGAVAFDVSGLLGIQGTVSGASISARSFDIDIGAGGQLGSIGTTSTLSLRNSGTRQTHIGGTGGTGTYGLSDAEAQRLHAGSITLVAPRIGAAGGIVPASISSRTPDVVLDTLNLSAGSGATANIGSSGTLRIETPGKLKTVGAVTLSNLGSGNRFEIVASDMLEVDPATGSILLRDGSSGLAGTLSLQSDDVVAASSSAITDIINALTMKDINDRLGHNDGAVNDGGVFQSDTLSVSVRNSFYIQNSGVNSANPRAFAARRGFTVGSGGLQINTLSPTARIAINGRQQDGLGGFITGLQLIPLARFNGGAAASGLFDIESTINGCGIINPALCNVGLTATDVAKDTITRAREQGDGTVIQISIIDLKGADDVNEEPVIDEPVTGSANDDFWSIDDDREEEESAAPAAP